MKTTRTEEMYRVNGINLLPFVCKGITVYLPYRPVGFNVDVQRQLDKGWGEAQIQDYWTTRAVRGTLTCPPKASKVYEADVHYCIPRRQLLAEVTANGVDRFRAHVGMIRNANLTAVKA